MKARWISLISGLIFLLIGSGQIFMSLRLPGGLGISAAEPGPGLFPCLVGILMTIASVSHLVQVWYAQRVKSAEVEKLPLDIFLLIGSMAAYILLLTRAGFMVAAFLLLYSTLTIYGMSGVWRRISVAVAGTAVSWLVFTLGLGVNFPQPTWFH